MSALWRHTKWRRLRKLYFLQKIFLISDRTIGKNSSKSFSWSFLSMLNRYQDVPASSVRNVFYAERKPEVPTSSRSRQTSWSCWQGSQWWEQAGRKTAHGQKDRQQAFCLGTDKRRWDWMFQLSRMKLPIWKRTIRSPTLPRPSSISRTKMPCLAGELFKEELEVRFHQFSRKSGSSMMPCSFLACRTMSRSAPRSSSISKTPASSRSR